MRAQGAGTFSGMRNRIINGAMVIDQRNAGSATTPGSNGLYLLDRWMGSVVGASSKFSVQQDSSANTVAGFTSSLKITSLSSYSVASGDIQGVQQKIEGYNVSDLAWGTANAKPVTLSFWVRSSLTGTFGAALQNSAVDRSYPFTYTIVAANTWEQKVITIPGDTSGTWLTTNGIGIRVNFSVGTGTTYSGTAGAWASGEYDSVTGAVSVVGTNAATWYITGVQLEAGSQATPFEYRDYGREFVLCQRYYQKQWGNNIQLPMGLMNQGSLSILGWVPPVPFRATPSLEQTAGSTWRFNGYTSGENLSCTWTLNSATNQVISISASAVPTSGNGYGVQCRAYDSSNYLALSAEL
jgi:hypothetical protein